MISFKGKECGLGQTMPSRHRHDVTSFLDMQRSPTSSSCRLFARLHRQTMEREKSEAIPTPRGAALRVASYKSPPLQLAPFRAPTATRC
jgi:hypothetical protein